MREDGCGSGQQHTGGDQQRAATVSNDVDSDAEEELAEQMAVDLKNEVEEDALIEKIGMRVLDFRGDVVLDPDMEPGNNDNSSSNNIADRVLTVQEIAGPCQSVIPDVKMDEKVKNIRGCLISFNVLFCSFRSLHSFHSHIPLYLLVFFLFIPVRRACI